MMNPIAITLTIVLSVLMMVVPRRYAVVPLILAACVVTVEQKFVVFGFNFTVVRIVLLAGWIRAVARSEVVIEGNRAIDIALVLWMLSAVVIYTILWHTPAALVNRLGHAYDALGLYFLFRCFCREIGDFAPVISVIAVVTAVLAAIMLYEYLSGINVFSVFGGVQTEGWMRGNHVRAQGPFRQPILAGCFAAGSFPLVVSLWFGGGWRRFFAVIGAGGACVMVFTTSSSGPMLAMLFGAIALGAWLVRDHLGLIRWSILSAVVLLAIFMKAPIWYLFARVASITGGGGWHRSFLVQQAFSHISEWWLIGTTYTAHWMPYSLDGRSADITNQFLVEGVDGGLITMVLFVFLIIAGFRAVGRALQKLSWSDREGRMIVWALGASLVAHVVSFLSVSYFDQIIVFWYLLLAFIASAAALSGSVVLEETPEVAIPPASIGGTLVAVDNRDSQGAGNE